MGYEWDMNGIFATDNGPFVEDLPIKMVMSYSYVELPKGICPVQRIATVSDFGHIQSCPPFLEVVEGISG